VLRTVRAGIRRSGSGVIDAGLRRIRIVSQSAGRSRGNGRRMFGTKQGVRGGMVDASLDLATMSPSRVLGDRRAARSSVVEPSSLVAA